jgi:hypothetical protein
LFIDYFNNASWSILSLGLGDFSEQMVFDGLWLDWNEPMGLCNGNSSGVCESTFGRRLEEKDYNTEWYTSY